MDANKDGLQVNDRIKQARPLGKGSFTLERSRAERSKDHNKTTAVTPKLQRSMQ